MFRKLKVIGFFLFFLLGIFLFNLNLSQAETIYLNQDDYSGEIVQPYFVNSAYDDFFQVFETQGIFGGDSINSIETFLRFHSTSTYGETYINLIECPTPFGGASGVICASGQVVKFNKLLYATNQLPVDYRNEWIRYLATSTTFVGTTTGYTMIYIDSNSPNFYLTDVRGSFNATIPSSYLMLKTFSNNYSTSTITNVIDLYLKVGLDIDVPVNNTGQYVDFVFPTNGTSTPDFKSWKTTYNLNSTTTNPSSIQIQVKYGTSSTNLNLSDIGHLIDYNFNYKNFFKLNVTDVGVYYAKLYLQTATSTYYLGSPPNIIASSSLITFAINEFNGGYDADDFIGPYPLPDLEECDLFDIFSPTDWSLFFTCLSQDLFWPNDDSLNTLKENINSFSGFFPFNIFFDFSNTVQNALSTTSSNTLYLDWEVGGYTATGTILSPTLFYDTLGTSTTDLIFNLQRNGLWLFTGFKILSFLL